MKGINRFCKTKKHGPLSARAKMKHPFCEKETYKRRKVNTLWAKNKHPFGSGNIDVFPIRGRVQLNPADNLIQPDLFIVCDPKKIENGKTCKGAPDMVVEILSPSTSRTDRIVKLDQYKKAGVREYSLVDPEDRDVQVNLLKDGEYVNQGYYDDADTIPVNIFEDCQIDLTKVFPPLPAVEVSENTEAPTE